MRRLIALLPLAVFAVVAGYFLVNLTSGRDPRELPSALIDQPAPQFALPPLEAVGKPGLGTADLKGQVHLVNFFASWCVPCRAEHPVLVRLAEQGTVPVVGIAYKDKPEASAAWLGQLGNPYGRIGVDLNGRAAIDWGVTGVPETFIVDREGRIRYRHWGPIDPVAMEQKILPLVKELQR
ncbi:MAG TPA: DsbE family thiol:disulfide interchange protein [Alphaproteobacteria bacterium]|nr:DsbE family thiol:disulfide interchange protein [Alphaproteobacteria bacterium]